MRNLVPIITNLFTYLIEIPLCKANLPTLGTFTFCYRVNALPEWSLPPLGHGHQGVDPLLTPPGLWHPHHATTLSRSLPHSSWVPTSPSGHPLMWISLSIHKLSRHMAQTLTPYSRLPSHTDVFLISLSLHSSILAYPALLLPWTTNSCSHLPRRPPQTWCGSGNSRRFKFG